MNTQTITEHRKLLTPAALWAHEDCAKCSPASTVRPSHLSSEYSQFVLRLQRPEFQESSLPTAPSVHMNSFYANCALTTVKTQFNGFYELRLLNQIVNMLSNQHLKTLEKSNASLLSIKGQKGVWQRVSSRLSTQLPNYFSKIGNVSRV